MTKLVLIRHGETDDNKNQNLCGWSNPCLNDNGRKAAEGLAKYLEDTELDLIINSGLKRSEETGAIISKEREIEQITLEDLRELNFGEFEGSKMIDIEKKHPELYRQMEKDFIHFKFPKGESLKEMNDRVIAATNKLLEDYKDKTIALVVHSGVIRCILAHFITGEINRHWSFKVEHCSISIMEIHQGFPVLTKLNDIAFLDKQYRKEEKQ